MKTDIKAELKAIIEEAGATGRLVVGTVTDTIYVTSTATGVHWGVSDKRAGMAARIDKAILHDRLKARDAARADAEWYELPEPREDCEVLHELEMEAWQDQFSLVIRLSHSPVEADKADTQAIIYGEASAAILRKIDKALENGKPINHDAVKALLARIDTRSDKEETTT